MRNRPRITNGMGVIVKLRISTIIVIGRTDERDSFV